MENLAGYALEVNIGGGDALEVSVGEASMLRGADGITPTIGENGNWYLGETDTGKPSRGADGATGAPGVYYGTTPPTGDTHPVWIDPNGDHDDGGLLPAVTAADNGKVLRVVNSAWSAEVMPTGGTDMGITGATVGQIAKITAVDGTGKPTAWGQADMPDKLPNPNALTFTGAVTGSYDGSEPLTVNIPSSGGGSGGSGGLPNWRLIKTLAFSSEIAEIIFSEDDNGEAFAVKEIMIVGTVPAFTSGGYLYCGIETGGLNAVWPTAGKEMRWWLASVNGVLKTMLAVSNTAVTLAVDKNFGCPSDLVTIRVGASQGFTGNGTLYVYGR